MRVMGGHRDRVVDQFTRQAEPFSRAAPITDETALQLVVEATGAGADDEVLDVACGPGIVVCAFAPVVRHATGIDITPAMIERAKALASERKLENVLWLVGDVEPLPFADASFSIVVSRLAFHHFERPGAVLSEMQRVCRPGGVVAVVDLTAPDDPSQAAAMNAMERIRDPSHVRALSRAELEGLFGQAGLSPPRTIHYDLELEVDAWLARSFPAADDVVEIRKRFDAAVHDDTMGLSVRRVGGSIHFRYRVAVCVSRRGGSNA
jgi:ubiquinone/menaquinone biosynthesis C-methylase UbiE